MDDAGFRIVPAAQARRILTGGDVRSDVAFQHDVNHLIASLEELLDAAASGGELPLSTSGRTRTGTADRSSRRPG